MPIHRLQGPDGTIHRIEAPADTPPEALVAFLATQLGEGGRKKSPIENIPIVGDVLSGIADVPLGLAAGLAGTAKTVTDVFGASNVASDWLEGVSKGATALTSAEAREDAARDAAELAQAEGFWESAGAAGRSFVRHPLDVTANLLGSAAPFAAAGVAGAALAPATGGASLIPFATMAGLGAVSGAGMIKGDIYDATYERAKKAKLSDEQAARIAEQAQEYGGENLDMIALGAGIGAAASATGVSSQLARMIGVGAAKEVVAKSAARAAEKGLIRRGAEATAVEALPEGVQAAQEQYAKNIAQERAGFPTDRWEGVLEQGAYEGVLGGILGGGLSMVEGRKAAAPEVDAEALARDEPGAETEAESAALQRFTDLGFDKETARTIVRNAQFQKEAVARQAAEEERLREEEVAERTAGISPDMEPDITAPGMQPFVPTGRPSFAPDEEERAVMLRAYEEEAGFEPAPADTPSIVPKVAPDIESLSPQAQFGEQLGVKGEDLAAKSRAYNARQREIASIEDAIGQYANMTARGQLAPTPLVNSIASRLVDINVKGGIEALASGRLGPAIQQFYANEAATINEVAAQKQQQAAPAPQPTPGPESMAFYPTGGDLTPERAGRIANDQDALDEYLTRGGDYQELLAIARGEDVGYTPKYSRGRRPIDTATPDMFAGAPVQQAPSEAAKREEFNALRFAPEAEKAARQEQLAAEAEAGQERIAGMQQRAEEAKVAKLDELQQAIYTAHPSNRAYTVDYREGSRNPYRVLGPNGEVFATEDNLDAFEESVGDLLPYTTESQRAFAVDEVEKPGPEEQAEPTVATRMVQDFVAEVDAAREAGQIDNNQRAELLGRLERPDAYKIVNGKEKPNDAIARNEVAARKAMERFSNAAAADKAAAEEALVIANQTLANSVKNALLNPARAKLKSMAEMRQDEKVGAKQRIREATPQLEAASVQKRLGEMEGATTTAEQGAVKAAKEELRSAKIDLKEAKVQKYRRAPAKGGTAADTVQRVVDETAKQWKSKNPIRVVQSIDDIPDAKVRRAIKRDGATDAEGLVAPDGTIYLIADNLTDESRAKAVLFHEGLGHVGLEKLFREKLDSVLTALYNSNAKLKADTDAWVKANPDAYKGDTNALARAVEEVLAERSEKGRIEPSLLGRIAAVIRNFARRMGIQLKFSNADVEAILAAAHERTVLGPQESTLVKGMRYVGAQVRPGPTRKQSKKVVDAAAGLSAGRRRVDSTLSTYGMMDGIEEATGATPKLRDAIAFAEDTSSPLRRAALKSMPTSGITGWMQRKAPKVYEVAEELVDTIRKMNGLRTNLMAAGDGIVRDMADFVRTHGSTTLARAQFTNRINEIDFLAFDTQAEALANHRLVKDIEKQLLSNSNNKAETRRLLNEIKEQAAKDSDNTSVLKDKVNLSTPLKAKANDLSKLAVDADKVLLKVKQLAAVTQRIRDSYAVKTELAKQKGGLALYKAERQYHKDILEARQALLDERIERGLGKEQAIRIRDMRARMMREMQSPNERQKAGDLFWDLDADLFDKEYFPMLRDGQYWLRVKEDLSKGREEQFYVFESARELSQARRKLAAQLKEDAESSGVFEEGNDIGELQNTLRESDALMQRVFDIVGKARDEYAKSDNVDMRQLMDEIFQTWLMTTPERSARRHFMHAKQIAGFSPDTLGNLQNQISTNANELTKLAYAGRVRAKVSAVKDTINDPERPVSEKTMLGDFARELQLRAEQELNPPPKGALNTFVNALNRFSFFYFLTSAKTALTNFANIPIRVVPRFWRDYGYAEGTAMWIKYMKMWDSLGRVKIERTNKRFGDYVDAIMPTVNGSNFVKNSEDLQWAMKAGTERGILMTTADTMVHNERANPLTAKGSITGKLQDLNANVGKAMSFLFTGTENISRQATFYMAFELEMKKRAKENPNMPLEQRREIALQKALRIVDDTIGNFADWERPRIAKGEATRAFFLFKMHPILQTKFMVGAFRDIIAAPLRGAARQATGKGKLDKQDTAYVAGALKEFSGVLMMGGLLGGLTAMPFYTVMAHALAEGFDQEDDDDVRKLMGIDPRTAYDADIMFRRWIMEHLGTPEKEDVDIADMFISGIPGALTDTEISSTLSLDLVNMWYREPIAGDSLESTMTAALIANIAGFSMVSQMLKSYEDFEKDNTSAALKKLLPAFFRAPVTAYYSAEEGVKTRKGDTVIPKEDITGGDVLRSALGARSARLARWQDYYITRAKNEDRIEGEKAEILGELNRKIESGEIASQEAFRDFWDETIVPFNRTYPNPDLIITMDSVERSRKGRAAREARTVQGMYVPKKGAAQTEKSAAPFRP